MGTTPEEKGRIADARWYIEMNGFMPVGEALRNFTPRLQGRALPGPHNYEQIPALAERGKERMKNFLNEIDAMIGDKPFVAGDTYSVADIDLLVMVDFSGWLMLAPMQN